MNKKMADVDIDRFGEHQSRTEEPTDEHIPLDLVTPAGGGISTWEPERDGNLHSGEEKVKEIEC